jgi:hypothetical protein
MNGAPEVWTGFMGTRPLVARLDKTRLTYSYMGM